MDQRGLRREQLEEKFRAYEVALGLNEDSSVESAIYLNARREELIDLLLDIIEQSEGIR